MKTIVIAMAVAAALLGGTGAAHAESGTVQVMIAGALSSPTGPTQDNQLTLRAGPQLPVFLVAGGAVVAGPIAAAAFVQWTDTQPTTGFGPAVTLVVLRLDGGVRLLAASIDTPGGPLTTLSGTAPVDTLTGTWTMTSGAGITGATANDAVLTLNFDTNPNNTIQLEAMFVATNVFPIPLRPVPAIPGGGSVLVARNAPLHTVVPAATDAAVSPDALPVVGPQIGILTSYGAFFDMDPVEDSYQFAEVTGLKAGDIYLLYACAYLSPDELPACRVGARNPLGHLSGVARNVGPSSVQGATQNDLIVDFDFSHP